MWMWNYIAGNNDRKFEVEIYEEDYKELCAHVLRKPNIETGGDLFGLWVDEYKAVVQLALGPGQECRRTSTSFYQDVEYLKNVGSYLTQNEGLCHIGEWHSHHQLGLARPSGGDENTVWNNMPAYKLSKFVIFIANIEASHKSYKVNIGCFLFEIDSKGDRLPVLQGVFKILPSRNPFSRKTEVCLKREKGAEKLRGKEANIDIEILKLKGERESPFVTMMRRPHFEVVIYEEDYSKLRTWVLEKPNIETGGDLFGLWVDEHKAIIQVTLGPGQRCKRTSASFYQDVEYLEKVGSYLTQNEGLCHIGEWHSHHRLGLPRPSGGDENTVWNNMPTYKLSKFVIFIANIDASFCNMVQGVNVNCFLFETDKEGHRLPVLQGEFKILRSENPFSHKKEVKEKRNEGAERLTGKRINSSEWNGNNTKHPKTERNERHKDSTPGTKQENHVNSGGCASAVQVGTSGHENKKAHAPELPLRQSDLRPDSITPGYKDKETDGVNVEPPEVNKGSSGSESKTETSEPNIRGRSLEVDQHSSHPNDTETPSNKDTEQRDVTAKPQEPVNKGSSGSEDKTETSEPDISNKNLKVDQHSSEPKDLAMSDGKDKKTKGSTTGGPAEEEESKDDEGGEERSGSTEDDKICLQPSNSPQDQPSNSEAEKERSAERCGGPEGPDDTAESIRNGRDDNRDSADLLPDVKIQRKTSGDSEIPDEEHTSQESLTTGVPAAGQSEEKADEKADEDAKNKDKRGLEGGDETGKGKEEETQKHLKEKTKNTGNVDYQEQTPAVDTTGEMENDSRTDESNEAPKTISKEPGEDLESQVGSASAAGKLNPKVPAETPCKQPQQSTSTNAKEKLQPENFIDKVGTKTTDVGVKQVLSAAQERKEDAEGTKVKKTT